MELWEKLLIGVLAAAVLMWVGPGLRASLAQRRKASGQEWLGALIPIAIVALFVGFLMLSV